MRTHLALTVATAALFMIVGAEPAQEKPREIIDKALKALGGRERFDKFQASRTKTKGTLELAGGIAFTQQVVTQQPDQFKESLEMQVMGKDVTVITVFNGKEGWLSVNGEAKNAEGKILDELKEGAYMLRIGRLLLKDKDIELAPLGETKVDGKEAIGVKLSSKGHRDVNVYFDKKTGLPMKVEHRVHDFQKNQDVNEERIIKEYMEIDGIKIPKKVVVERDGKKFMEVEVQEVKLLESVDKGEFVKP